MVYLGLDLGSKTLGVAVSDRTGIIASSLEVLRYNDYDELLSKLDKIVEERHVDVFVLGNPLNLNGSVSVRSEMSFEFKGMLEKRYLKEVLQGEISLVADKLPLRYLVLLILFVEEFIKSRSSIAVFSQIFQRRQ